MNLNLEFAQKFVLAYNEKTKPLCHALKLPQTALDILLFLANNPEYKTASDVVEVRKLKANLVSVNVERLVREGYLRRESVPGDRRKTLLVCTEKAAPVIEQGRAVQEAFWTQLFADTDEAQRAAFLATVERMGKNLDAMIEGDT